MKWTILTRAGVMCLALGSAAYGTPSLAHELVTRQQELVAKLDLWPQDPGGDTYTIPICFENVDAQDADLRSNIRTDLERSWAAYSQIVVTGFQKCPATFNGVRIRITDTNDTDLYKCPEGRACAHVGFSKAGEKNGLVLHRYNAPKHKDWHEDTRRRAQRSTIVHEFGHSLGFRHEQTRMDTTEDCYDEGHRTFHGLDGAHLSATPYDPFSIMNYCGQWTDALSPGDVTGLRRFYGGSKSDQLTGRAFAGDGRKIVHQSNWLGMSLATGVFDHNDEQFVLAGDPTAALFDPTSQSITSNAGVVFQYKVNSEGVLTQFGRIQSQSGAAEYYGAAIAVADFDGDGFQDLAVGAPGARQGGDNRGFGRVYIYFGGAAPVFIDAQRTIIEAPALLSDAGPRAFNGFGAALAVGDLTGNGNADLAIGYPGADGNKGRVFVLTFRGRSASLTEAPRSKLPHTSLFGEELATYRLNADTRSDLLVTSRAGDGSVILVEPILHRVGPQRLEIGNPLLAATNAAGNALLLTPRVVAGRVGPEGLRVIALSAPSSGEINVAALNSQGQVLQNIRIKAEEQDRGAYGSDLLIADVLPTAGAELLIGAPVATVEELGAIGRVDVFVVNSWGAYPLQSLTPSALAAPSKLTYSWFGLSLAAMDLVPGAPKEVVVAAPFMMHGGQTSQLMAFRIPPPFLASHQMVGPAPMSLPRE